MVYGATSVVGFAARGPSSAGKGPRLWDPGRMGLGSRLQDLVGVRSQLGGRPSSNPPPADRAPPSPSGRGPGRLLGPWPPAGPEQSREGARPGRAEDNPPPWGKRGEHLPSPSRAGRAAAAARRPRPLAGGKKKGLQDGGKQNHRNFPQVSFNPPPINPALPSLSLSQSKFSLPLVFLVFLPGMLSRSSAIPSPFGKITARGAQPGPGPGKKASGASTP